MECSNIIEVKNEKKEINKGAIDKNTLNGYNLKNNDFSKNLTTNNIEKKIINSQISISNFYPTFGAKNENKIFNFQNPFENSNKINNKINEKNNTNNFNNNNKPKINENSNNIININNNNENNAMDLKEEFLIKSKEKQKNNIIISENFETLKLKHIIR